MYTPRDHSDKRREMTSPENLETVELADRLAVTDVVFTVARAMDSKDWTTLADNYIPDSVGDYESGEVLGRDKIIAAAEGFLTSFDATQHLVGNVQVSIDGDVAVAHSTFIAQHVRDAAEGSGRFLMGGTYDDTFARVSGEWRIVRRRIRGIWGDGDASVLAAQSAL